MIAESCWDLSASGEQILKSRRKHTSPSSQASSALSNGMSNVGMRLAKTPEVEENRRVEPLWANRADNARTDGRTPGQIECDRECACSCYWPVIFVRSAGRHGGRERCSWRPPTCPAQPSQHAAPPARLLIQPTVTAAGRRTQSVLRSARQPHGTAFSPRCVLLLLLRW